MREARRALHPLTVHALHDAAKSIVLLNRRGWSNFLTCRTCGEVWMCPDCDVSLVLHRGEELIACHHCGHREPVPSRCDACGSVSIGRHGTGTERLEHELAEAGHPVFRLDADTPRAASVLAAFEAAPRGILVGTQMVAKGHDFPDVTLGVVLDADATLRFPDFRAEERTFALVAQLAGRAGRGAQDGRVLVQTIAPDAPSLAFAARHDSEGFLAGELARREALRYPPFSTLIRVVCSSAEPGRGGDRRAGGARARCRCRRWARRRCSACAAASAARWSSRPPTAGRRSPRSTPPCATWRPAGRTGPPPSASTWTRSSLGPDERRGPAGRPARPSRRARVRGAARTRPRVSTRSCAARREAALTHVRVYGDPVLRTEARPVDRFDEALLDEVARMGGLMNDAMGIGLAATQVGMPHRLLVYRVEHDSPVNALVNPEILWSSKEHGDLRGGLPEPARACTSTSSGRSTCGSAPATSAARRS